MHKNPLTIELLEILDAIDRRGSFAKAAEELNKATSALSYAIQKLEEQLDISIYQRQGRRSVLTPAGKVLLDEGRLILQATKNLTEKSREVATGWEPRLRIGLDSMINAALFFKLLNTFLNAHPTLEIDICETVLNGGWEALEQDRIDLLAGCIGPMPAQKGFRSIQLGNNDLLPVVAAKHPLAKIANNTKALENEIPKTRRIVLHDSAQKNVTRNEGLSLGKTILYVQTIDQKIQAQLAGLGIGHLPRHRIQHYLKSGELIPLNISASDTDQLLAWKGNNKGKALQTFTKILSEAKW